MRKILKNDDGYYLLALLVSITIAIIMIRIWYEVAINGR
jgi:hypothetical protein